jgi:hypothetical protein
MHGATPPYTLMPSWHAKNSSHTEDSSSSRSTGGGSSGGGGGSSSSSGSQITVVIIFTTGVYTPVDSPNDAAYYTDPFLMYYIWFNITVRTY